MPETLSPEHFVPGTQVVVERRIGQHQRKAVTRVIGAHPPRFLLLDEPKIKERPLLDPDDDNCIVRFLKDGRAFGFRAQVVSHSTDPFSMLVLSYPLDFQQVSVRDEDRIGCGIPATLSRPEDAPEIPPEELPRHPLIATILDLSPGGCQLAIPMVDPSDPKLSGYHREKTIPNAHPGDYLPKRIENMCPPEARLHLNFELPPPWPAQYERIVTHVRWARAFRGFFLLGIRFIEYPADFVENTRKLVNHQIKYFTQPI